MRQKYKADLTDSGLLPLKVCEKWDKRELVNAVFRWITAVNGLPHDFPPYSTVHSFYRRARLSGLWDNILQHLVGVTESRKKSHLRYY